MSVKCRAVRGVDRRTKRILAVHPSHPAVYNLNWLPFRLYRHNLKGGIFMSKHKNIRDIAILAVLVAANIVLARLLSVQMWNMKFSFSFLTVAIAGALCGVWGGAIVGGLSDFLGAILFPAGTYFPGFTLTAVIVGIVFGLFFKKKFSFVRISLAVIITQICCTLLLNSLWVSILYGSPFLPVLTTRLLQAGIMTVVQIVSMYLLFDKLNILHRIKLL